MKKILIIFLFMISINILCACNNSETYTVIKEVEATVDYNSYTVTSDIACEIKGAKDIEYIRLKFTTFQKNIFTKETVVYINGIKLTDGYNVSSNGHELTCKYQNPCYEENPAKVLREVRFILDTIEYTAKSLNSEAYNVNVEVDSNHVYITTKVTMNDGYKLAREFSVYVNDDLVEKDYTINEDRTELIYKIKDPNWTPYY